MRWIQNFLQRSALGQACRMFRNTDKSPPFARVERRRSRPEIVMAENVRRAHQLWLSTKGAKGRDRQR
jgi:hypothetical protein